MLKYIKMLEMAKNVGATNFASYHRAVECSADPATDFDGQHVSHQIIEELSPLPRHEQKKALTAMADEFKANRDKAKKRLDGMRANQDERSRFFRYMLEANIICFEDTRGISEDIGFNGIKKSVVEEDADALDGFGDLRLDLPFRTCFLESLTGTHTYDCGTEENGPWEKPLTGMLIHEIGPEKYDIFTLTEGHELEEGGCAIWYWRVPEDDPSKMWMFAAKKLLSQMSREKIGCEKTNEKVKIKVNGENVFRRINQIVRVMPKNMMAAAKPVFGGHEIDWSHRWEVRGFWRKTDGIGKNREGIYCIPKFTWVKDHVRGPDGKPLVKKTRLVVSEEKGMVAT